MRKDHRSVEFKKGELVVLGAIPYAPANTCNGMLIHICRWIEALSRRRKIGRLAELQLRL